MRATAAGAGALGRAGAGVRARSRARAAAAAAVVALALSAWSASAPAATPASARVALVIGNATYPQAPLRNPVNDARAVAAALERLGYAVTLHENLGLEPLRDAMRRFVIGSRDAELRLVFFAGHGLQLRGRNYLLPVDATLRNEDDVIRRTADASELVEHLGAIRTGANVVIIDACRVHPVFNTRRMWQVRPSLAAVEPPTGTVVAFSTRPGAVAYDGDGTTGIYARHLVRAMREVPSLPVEAFFKRVRSGVVAETQRAQVPWEASDLDGELCLRPQSNGRCGTPP